MLKGGILGHQLQFKIMPVIPRFTIMLNILTTTLFHFCPSNAISGIQNRTFIHFQEHSNVIYLTGVIGDVIETSLSMCALHCRNRNCLSFSHSNKTGFCRLHNFKYPPCYPNPATINVTSVQVSFYREDDGDNAICPCKMDLTDGSWIVMQQRFDGSVNFKEDWKAYKEGFGNPPHGEFWLGLEQVHQLTTNSQYILVVELMDKHGVRGCACFNKFSIGPESDGYRLNARQYHGTAGNSLAYHNDNMFSTMDRDNDNRGPNMKSCAEEYKCGNWYNACLVQNLNGPYLQLPHSPNQMVWKTFRNFSGLLKSKMALKKKLEVYNII